MKKKAVLLTLVIFMFSVTLAMLSIKPVNADPNIIMVPDDYKKIQWAVGNATAGDIINVSSGTYREQVTVNKSLTLFGENPSTTIIDGFAITDGDYVIKCNANYVNISGFTIRNGKRGIGLDHCDNITISGNVIANNSQYGIFLLYSSNNTIHNNTVLNNGDRGIYLRNYSSDNIVSNNTVSNHREWGIYLFNHSSNNVVSSNTILNSGDRGIYLIDAGNNVFNGNKVLNNTIGISIRASAGNTLRNNKIYGNRYNFDISGTGLGQYVQDIDTSNTVNGKPMYYWMNQTDKQVPAEAGYVAVINSKNITVKNQTLTKNKQGVLFAYTTNSTIVNVNAAYNFIGIRIVEGWPPKSGNNVIKDNILANNYEGIGFTFSSDNTFTGNTVINNYYGVSSAFCNNTLYHNNFLDNINLTYRNVSLSIINVWDNGYPSGGNHWSDYNGTDLYSGPYQNETGSDGIGDTPHVIDEYNRDNYPFISPLGDIEPPVADAGLNQSVLQGTTVTFDGSGSTDDVGIKSYVWTFVDVTLQTLTGIKPTYTFNNTGNFEVTLNISDYTDKWDIDTMWVNVSADVTNPTANAGPDQTVDEDTLVTFNGSASWDNVGITSYTWAFTDVTPKILTGVNPTYTFETPGIYNITLNVTDVAQNWDTDTVTITVLDITDPVADAGPDQTVDEDTLVTFNGSVSTDNVGIVNYTWTFVDVTPQTLTGVSPTYNFTNPDVFIVTLNVSDAAGNWDTDTVTITVLDVTPPVADAGPDQKVKVGTTVTFDASGSNDNVGIVSYEWDFGDGTNGIGVTTNHTYTKPETYTVTLKVKDAANNSATDSITVTVVPTPFPWWIAGLLVAAGIVAAIVAYLVKVRKPAKT